MATFELICPHCNNKLNIAEEFIGEEVTCRYCLKKLMPTRSEEVNASARSIKEPQSMQNKENKMETFEVTCPHCGTAFVCPEQYARQTVNCPHCGELVKVVQEKSQSWTPQPINISSHKLAGNNTPYAADSFKEPLCCKILHVLGIINTVVASLFALSFLICLLKVEKEVILFGISFLVSGTNALLCYAGKEYLHRSLKYQWETANNTKDIVRLLKK